MYLPGDELYVHNFPQMCTFSDVRKVIETEGIAKEGEYSLVIGSDSSTVISHKNDSKEVKKFLEFKEAKG